MKQQLTKEQLAIKAGDRVEVLRDNGTREMRTVWSPPEKLGGHTWVVWLEGITGAYQLVRCTPCAEEQGHA